MREHALKIWRNPSKAREVRAEVANGIAVPDYLEAQFSGPEGKIRYALLMEKLCGLFEFAYSQEIVIDPACLGRHEIPLLEAKGHKVRIADRQSGEEGMKEFEGPNFEMSPVSESDLGVAIVMLGGECSHPGQYLFRNVGIKVKDGRVTFNRTLISRPTTLVYGGHAVQLDALQSGWMVLMVAMTMWPFMPGSHVNSKFRNAIMAAAQFCTNKTETGYADAVHRFVADNRRGMVGMMVGLRGPSLAPTQDVIDLYSKASRTYPALIGPQGETAINFEAIGKVRDGKLYLASRDETKMFKRLLLNKQAQVHLADGFDIGKTSYKGHREEGRRFTYVLAPSLPPAFTGGPGSILALTTQEEMGKTFPLLIKKAMEGTCYGIPKDSASKVLGSLPPIGSPLPSVLNPVGSVIPFPTEEFAGAKVVDVEVSTPDDFGNCFWRLVVEILDESGQIKAKSSLKGTFGYTSQVVGPNTLETVGLSIVTHDGKPLRGKACAGADATKAFGKGCAQGKFNLAVETIEESLVTALLPKETYRDGIPEFDEELDHQGAYDALVDELSSPARQRVATWTRKMPEHLYLNLRQIYASDKLYLGAEDFTLNIGTNVLGFKDTCRFRNDGDKFSVAWTTSFLEVEEIVKVETISVSQDCGYSPSMLEVASFAKSINLHNTAAMLVRGGRHQVDAVKDTAEMLAYRPTEQEIAKTAFAFHSSNQTSNNAEKLAWLVNTPVGCWPEDVRLALKTRAGAVFAVDRKVLEGFAGTDAGHVIRTALVIAKMASEGNAQQAESLATGLYAAISSVARSDEFYKRLNRGSMSVSAKRMAVIVPEDGHRYVYLNPDGVVAAKLAKLYGCEPWQLEGRMAIGYRAPMFMGVPLKIRLVSWVPRHMIGVVDEVASFDEGDFDGDRYFLIPVLCRKAEAELERVSIRKMKDLVHTMSVRKVDHWAEANTWAVKPWAKSQETTIQGMVHVCIRAMLHQILEMPTDANRAHLGLALASMFKENPYLALGMKMFVYEPQLAGFSEAWHRIHGEMGEYFPEFAQSAEEVSLSDELIDFWWRTIHGHRAYNKKKKFFASKDGFCYVKTDNLQHQANSMLAGAFKKLAQGQQRPQDTNSLLPMLGRIVLTSDNGSVDLWKEIERLAADGVPAAIRIKESLLEIQPLVGRIRTQNDNEQETDD